MLNDKIFGFKMIAETSRRKASLCRSTNISLRSHVTAKRSIRGNNISITVIRSRPRSASSKSARHVRENIIRKMREKKLTFQEAVGMAPGFWPLEKQACAWCAGELLEQLERTPFAR